MGLTENDADNIVEALGTWEPPKGKSEAAYETALYAFLHERFSKEVFHRQYARGKTRADLYVEFKDAARVVVELKRNLTDRAEYHRLLGQVYEYLTEWKVEVVVVLCGANDPALAKLTRGACEFLGNGSGKKVRFVEKRC